MWAAVILAEFIDVSRRDDIDAIVVLGSNNEGPHSCSMSVVTPCN
jgi:hypothetical protein